MELSDLATAVHNDCVRGTLMDVMSSEEAAAFESYVDEYATSDLQDKKDKFV